MAQVMRALDPRSGPQIKLLNPAYGMREEEGETSE